MVAVPYMNLYLNRPIWPSYVAMWPSSVAELSTWNIDPMALAPQILNGEKPGSTGKGEMLRCGDQKSTEVRRVKTQTQMKEKKRVSALTLDLRAQVAQCHLPM